jgi:hypothetical protein
MVMVIIRRIICIFMCLIAVLGNSFQLYAAERTGQPTHREVKYNNKLKKAHTPQEVIDQIDEDFKEYICENMEKNEYFESYEYEDVAGENLKGREDNSKLKRALSNSDMELKVFATRVKINGIEYGKIYPSFKWKKSAAIKNDSFAFALYSGWSSKTNESPKLTIAAYRENKIINSNNITYALANEAGYVFRIPRTYGMVPLPQGGYFRGYTNFYARKVNKRAENGISLTYVHDTSSLFNVSYGINIWFASISITKQSNDLFTFSKNLGFSYSTK